MSDKLDKELPPAARGCYFENKGVCLRSDGDSSLLPRRCVKRDGINQRCTPERLIMKYSFGLAG